MAILRMLYFVNLYICYTVVLANVKETEMKWTNVDATNMRLLEKSAEPTPNVLSRISLWFLKGAFRDVDLQNLPLLPGEDRTSDRVINQLIFVPPNFNKNIPVEEYKKIYITPGSDSWWHLKLGTDTFKDCPVHTCSIVDDLEAEFVLNRVQNYSKKHERQIVILYNVESPLRDLRLTSDVDLVSNYRIDSDIPVSYDKFVYFNETVRQKPQTKNFAETKTKLVAWFVSNCWASNNRLEVARKLQQHTQVEIYGRCGTKECPKPKGSFISSVDCLEMLSKQYKFYLAFENSNCRDYVSEKFFRNALKYDIVPIVMGASKEEYLKVAPENSFIHVDDFKTMRELADYLELLNKNDTLYNEYFKWKGTGQCIDRNSAHYWCRLCAVLNSPNIQDRTKWALYGTTFEEWWRGEGECRENFKA